MKNCAVIGYGPIGKEWILSLRSAGMDPHLIVKSSDRVDRASREMMRVLGSYQAIKIFAIDDTSLESYDHVVVAVPIRDSVDVVVKLAATGCKRIVCEKPLAIAYGDLAKVVNATNGRCSVSIAFNRRHFSTVKLLKHHLVNEPVRSAFVSIGEPSLRLIERGHGEMLSSWLMANTIHMIDLSTYLFGPELWGEALKTKRSGCRSVILGDSSRLRGVNSAGSYGTRVFGDFLRGGWGIKVRTETDVFRLRPLEILTKNGAVVHRQDVSSKPGYLSMAEAIRDDSWEAFGTLSDVEFYMGICDRLQGKRRP